MRRIRIVTFRIMPSSVDVNLDSISDKILKEIKTFTKTENFKKELVPVAFGLKALSIMFVMPEEMGGTDPLEDKIREIEGVESVEVTDVRRAIG